MPSQQDSSFSAERMFTDRENYFDAFKNALANMYNHEYSVLYFYGVGGIGKTRLKRELSKHLKKEGNYIISDSLNFQETEFRSTNSAVYTLYNDLKKHSIKFPAFEIAYTIYWQKLHPQLKLTQSDLPFIEEGSIVSDFISAFGDLPLVGLLPKVATVMHKLKKKYREWWTKNGESALIGLGDLEVFQIEEQLQYFLALDLKDHYLANRQCVVFFIDTYEALWSKQEDRKNEKFFEKDKWIRTIIGNLPHTLWVILGRERLRWDEIPDDNWGDYVDQHLLSGLSPADCNMFLEACGIKDPTIRKQMINVSSGLPFYLDLQVDTYNRIISKRNTPSINDLPKKYSDILSRFCLYLGPAEIDTLKILSFARVWKFELFVLLIKEFQTGYPVTSFDELLKFSFINSSKDGNFSIHQIMQFHLQEEVSEDMKKRIHSFLFSYYNQQLKSDYLDKQDFFEFNPYVISILDEIIYHKKEYDSAESYYTWLLGTSKRGYGEASSSLLLESFEKCFRELDNKTNSHLQIEICSEMARLYAWKKNYALTEKSIHAGLQLCNKRQQEVYQNDLDRIAREESSLILLSTDLLIQQASLLNELDRNIESYQTYNEAFRVGDKIKYKPAKWGYYDLLLEIGRTPEAEGFFYTQLQISIERNDEDSVALLYSRIGKIFYLQGLFKESSLYYKKSIDMYSKLRGVDHKYYWLCQVSYARALVALNETTEAEKILIDSLNWNISKYGKSHADNGIIFLELAKAGLTKNDIYNGLNDLLVSLTLLQSKYGFSNSLVLECTMLLLSTIQKVINERINLEELGFSKDDCSAIYELYTAQINGAEWGFYNNYDNVKMNYGINSVVLKLYFNFFTEYYEVMSLREKRDIINNRKIELNRISKAQFQIRIFDAIALHEIDEEERGEISSILNHSIGVDGNIPVAIFSSKLPFYSKSSLYTIVLSDIVTKHVFVLEKKPYFLDWTNSSIYGINEKDFLLSPETVKDYVYFFFDAVKGRHGKFYFPMSSSDIPCRLDINVSSELINEISNKIVLLTILEATEDYIVLNGSCFFTNALMGTKVKVFKNGLIELLDKGVILLENIPVAVEPQIDVNAAHFTYEEILSRVIVFLNTIFSQPNFEETLDKLHRSMFVETRGNLQSLHNSLTTGGKISVPLINTTLNNSNVILDKYIKPKYDPFLYEKDMGIFETWIFQILEHNKSPERDN